MIRRSLNHGGRARAATLAAGVVITLGVGACTGSPDPSPTPSQIGRSTVSTQTKDGTGQVRTDLKPLTTRFSALGEPISATWMSGTLGGDAPGPSTYWVDAVVKLSPETATSLRKVATTTAADSPDVPAEVKAQIPAGELRRSPALDAKFAEGDFRAKAYLVEGTDTVVLVALGE